ncbi:Dna mismatch repair protein, partial [human gut metagenome]
ICDFLRGCRKIKSFIKDKEGYAETLSSYGENITELKYIEEEIENAIRGSIVDSNILFTFFILQLGYSLSINFFP